MKRFRDIGCQGHAEQQLTFLARWQAISRQCPTQNSPGTLLSTPAATETFSAQAVSPFSARAQGVLNKDARRVATWSLT